MKRTLAAALVIVLTWALGACTNDEPTPNIAEPTETSSSTPGASPIPAPPELPASASQPTANSAEAFVPFFWETVNFVQETLQPSPLRRLVSETCNECKAAIQFVNKARRSGATIDGGIYDVSDVTATDITVNGETAYSVSFKAHNTAQKIVRSGEVLEQYDESTIDIRFVLNFADPSWTVDVWEVLG